MPPSALHHNVAHTASPCHAADPLRTQVYIRHVGAAAEAALAQMRVDLFRMLLGNRVEFFDRFSQAELVTLISSQLGAIRDTIMSNTSRDRGLRAFLEAAGSVCILVWLSAEMGPLMAVVIVASGVVAAVHSRRQKELFAADARQVTQMVGVAGEAIGAIRTGAWDWLRRAPEVVRDPGACVEGAELWYDWWGCMGTWCAVVRVLGLQGYLVSGTSCTGHMVCRPPATLHVVFHASCTAPRHRGACSAKLCR